MTDAARPDAVVAVVDHEPGAWFLVTIDGELHLDARYTYSALIDDSALIRLGDTELARYRGGGHDFLNDLARRVHTSAPFRPESKFFARDLYRQSGGAELRAAITAAIAASRPRASAESPGRTTRRPRATA